jgi:hypothetical protein
VLCRPNGGLINDVSMVLCYSKSFEFPRPDEEVWELRIRAHHFPQIGPKRTATAASSKICYTHARPEQPEERPISRIRAVVSGEVSVVLDNRSGCMHTLPT